MCKKQSKQEMDLNQKSVLQNVISQKEYNSIKSAIFKKLFYGFEISSMILAASVPVILISNKINPIFPSSISAVSALLHSISHFAGFQKKWINCRNLTEQLKSEVRKYESSINEYDNKSSVEKNKILAQRLETIVASGNDFWIQVVNEKEEKK